MKQEKLYALLESVSEISFIAATMNYQTLDSREKFSQFIEWAKEFEYLHRSVEWGVNFKPEYIDSIKYFTLFKIKQWSI